MAPNQQHLQSGRPVAKHHDRAGRLGRFLHGFVIQRQGHEVDLPWVKLDERHEQATGVRA